MVSATGNFTPAVAYAGVTLYRFSFLSMVNRTGSSGSPGSRALGGLSRGIGDNPLHLTAYGAGRWSRLLRDEPDRLAARRCVAVTPAVAHVAAEAAGKDIRMPSAH